MKIKPEHFEKLKSELATFSKEKIAAHRKFIINEGKSKDVEKRLRWDLLYYRNLSAWVCDNIYPYADDSHLDTALRQIMKGLET